MPGLMLSLSNPDVGSDIRGRFKDIEWGKGKESVLRDELYTAFRNGLMTFHHQKASRVEAKAKQQPASRICHDEDNSSMQWYNMRSPHEKG